jgi:hypothetical protein
MKRRRYLCGRSIATDRYIKLWVNFDAYLCFQLNSWTVPDWPACCFLSFRETKRLDNESGDAFPHNITAHMSHNTDTNQQLTMFSLSRL